MRFRSANEKQFGILESYRLLSEFQSITWFKYINGQSSVGFKDSLREFFINIRSGYLDWEDVGYDSSRINPIRCLKKFIFLVQIVENQFTIG